LEFKYLKKFVPPKGPPLNRGAPCHGIIGILVNPALQLHFLTAGQRICGLLEGILRATNSLNNNNNNNNNRETVVGLYPPTGLMA